MGGAFRGRSLADAALYALVVTPPLLARRRWPLAAFAGVLAITAFAGPTATLAVMLAVYAVALEGRRDVVLAVVVAATAVLAATSGVHGERALVDWTLARLTLIGIAAAAGLWQGTRAKYVEQLRGRAARLEREQQRSPARRSPRSARGSPASCTTWSRHSVSLMVVQAGGAGDALDARAGARARGAAADRRRPGREALDRAAPAARRAARRRRRTAELRAAAGPRRARRRSSTQVRAAGLDGRAGGRGRAARAAAGRRPLGLPDRAGGADERRSSTPARARARASTSRYDATALELRDRRRRRRGRVGAPGDAAATGSSACASASRCSAASSTAGAAPRAAALRVRRAPAAARAGQ